MCNVRNIKCNVQTGVLAGVALSASVLVAVSQSAFCILQLARPLSGPLSFYIATVAVARMAPIH
jgi:hypothetical protein